MTSAKENLVLVFPSSTSAAVEYLERCRANGESAFGASSVRIDPNAPLFDGWAYLPQITSGDFYDEFRRLIEAQNISRIFCPLPVAHAYLKTLLARFEVGCILLPSPFDSELKRHKNLNERAIRAVAIAKSIVDRDINFSLNQVRSMLGYTDTVWGQCGELKLSALIAVMSSAPAGDTVEIGAFLGKSASALTMLAGWRHMGSVIAVDPWTPISAVQKDAPDYVQKLSQGDYWQSIFEQFICNLMPVANGIFNFIREAGEGARKCYGRAPLHTLEFGSVNCCGAIAVLHIDGNHDYDAVSLDAELWIPLVAPNGWVIFDDYLWAHGDGPKRVGDRVLEQLSSAIDRSFVCDGALFIKFNSRK